MRRKRLSFFAQLVVTLLILLQAVYTADDSYQSYIQALAYPARLVVRPDSSTVVVDSKISFFCRADGNPLPNVVWKINGKSLADQRFSTRSLPSGLSTLRIDPVITLDNNTVISCSADNGVANPMVAEAILTVIPRDDIPSGFPSIESHPTLKSVEQGRTAHINCRVLGDPRPKVLWLRDMVPIDVRAENRYSVSTIGNPGALMIQQSREEDQGRYECVARNSYGVVHSKAAHLYVKVRRVPPYFSMKLNKTYPVGMGGEVNLTCVAVGYPMPRVFWKKQGDVVLDDPATAPIGKNVLSLSNVESTENFTCVAVSKLGNIEATTTVEVKALAPPPRHLKILEVTSTSVRVQWEHPRTEDKILHYLVKYRQKSNSASSFVPLVTTNNDPQYADSHNIKMKNVDSRLKHLEVTGLEPFQVYEFSVQSVGEVGPGPATIPKEVQTAEELPATAPMKLQARCLNRDSILVKWSPSEKPNGIVTGYKILYTKEDPTTAYSNWKEHETKADELMATLYGMEPDTKYYMHVQAKNTKGYSPRSIMATVSTVYGIPGQPPNLQAKPADSRRVQLTWDKPLHSMPITGYTVRFNSSDGDREFTLTSPHEKHLVTGLEPNTYYAFRVSAQSSRGSGELSEATIAKTLESTAITAPRILSIESITSTILHLRWSRPATKESEISGFSIRYRIRPPEPVGMLSSDELSAEVEGSASEEVKEDPEFNEITVAATATNANLTGLLPFTLYELSMLAITVNGTGTATPLRQIRTAEDVPSAPKNFEVILSSPNTVKLSWEAPQYSNGHLGGYYIYDEKLLNGVPIRDKLHKKKVIIDNKKTTTELDNLDPNTEYAFRMNAFNRNGDGEFTDRKTIVTGGIPPRQPEIQSVVLLSDEAPLKARIDWKRPHLEPLESPIDRFHLWYKPEGSKTIKHKVVNGTETGAEIIGLWMGHIYEISVGAENVEGLSPNATEKLETPVGNPDGEPMNVQYEIHGKQMRISWDAPAEEKRNGNISYYKAILTPMDAEGERNEQQTSSRQVSFDLDTRKAYTFKVAAATMKGMGPYSPVLTINPDPNEPTTVIGAEPTEIYQMSSYEDISTAEVFNAIVSRVPGPLDIPLFEALSKTKNKPKKILEPTRRPEIALVGPPTNVRVEATSNTSAVVQWDFEQGQIDGFVVRYMHEPSIQREEKWISRTVQSSSVRHLEITHLTAHKPYAFCVMAIKNNRQGACSDPPTVLNALTPEYMVNNLEVEWKTSTSIRLRWQYNGPKPVGFYFNHTGKKEYFDQHLALKTMTTPGFKTDIPGDQPFFMLTNLRPYMMYTLHVGVYSAANQRQYWPQEVIVMTDPTGPPFVESPQLLIGENKPGQISVRLRPSSEEYGPISHYWIIVVPGNFSQDDVINYEPSKLQRLTDDRRRALAKQISASPAKKLKRDTSSQTGFPEDTVVPEIQERRIRRELPAAPYVTARISAESMRNLYQADSPFVIGDEKLHEGFTNFPLEPSSRYRLLMRAFAKEDRANQLNKRAPMTEKLSRMYSDSSLSDPFSTQRAARQGAKSGGLWLLGPLAALLVIAVLIVLLVCWWLRCNKKSAGRTHRHGSITKVALTGNIMNGIGPQETSKLLSSADYGRQIMNPYDQMNGSGCMESTLDLYPLPSRNNNLPYAPVPVALPSLPNGSLGGHIVSHPAIPIAELASHIDRLMVNNNIGFQREFESIETGQHFTWENSNAEMNKHKNRYANVVAYDHSRVILANMDDIPGTDYINANYIDGYDKPKAYIATQGPLPETFGDFWRMVWEEGSATIVMLTNLEERSRVKCDQYWPSRGSSTYGDVQVTFLEKTELAHYTMRAFNVQMSGEQDVRKIRHLQYTAWPDHGVPDHPTPFLIFLKRVKTLNPNDAGPIISHCSAGIGRTGAFIVIDCMLERLRYENTVDIFGCVTTLRSQRSYMVQTEDQYVFIHDAVLDAVNSGSTEVPAIKLHQHISQISQKDHHSGVSGMEMEFRHLSTLKWANNRCGAANLPANRHKNRYMNVVPFDNNRVILVAIPGMDGSDYINASWVDGYRERSAYIATQGPNENTQYDFWRMVWERESAIIVMLNTPYETQRNECYEYWPHSEAEQKGHLIVEPLAEYNMEFYILREFRLTDMHNNSARTVRHFQFVNWPEIGTPMSGEPMDTFIDFLQQVHKTKTQFGVEGPITVHCSNGAGRSGVFIALAILIDRMKVEQVVDVFTTVKLLRTERQNMVQDKEQYEMLYNACRDYLAAYYETHQTIS